MTASSPSDAAHGTGHASRAPSLVGGRGSKVRPRHAAASGPVTAQKPTRALGQDADRMNEVRYRAYALEARGWLLRERGGLFSS